MSLGLGTGPSIWDGELRYVSASQLEKFDHRYFGGCQRRWWFRYVARKSEPTGAGAKLGSQVHSQIEHYLKTGEDVMGEIVRPGRKFVPKPGPGLDVELEFGRALELMPAGAVGPMVSELDAGGVPMVGKVDALLRRGHWIDEDGEAREEDAAEVLDWKTSKQIDDDVDPLTGIVISRGFAKTADAMASTWQMLGYAELASRRWPDLEYVRVSHVYFQTKGKRVAAKRSRLLKVVDVHAKWAESPVIVDEMKSVAKQPEVKDVPANYAACSAYGGCPHRAYCPRDAMKAIASMFAGTKLASGGNEMSLLAKRRALQNGTAVNVAAAAVPPGPTAEVRAEMAALVAEEATALTPPDAPAPEKTHEPLEVKHVEAAAKAKKSKKAKVEYDAGAPGGPHAPYDAHAEPVGLTLYLDAIEDGVVAKRLEAYAEAKAAELAETCKAADVRSAPKDSPLAFGGWKGLLAAHVKEQPPEPGAYAVSSSSEFGVVAFEALASRARVVRGVR